MTSDLESCPESDRNVWTTMKNRYLKNSDLKSMCPPFNLTKLSKSHGKKKIKGFELSPDRSHIILFEATYPSKPV